MEGPAPRFVHAVPPFRWIARLARHCGRDLRSVAFPAPCLACDENLGDLPEAGVCLRCWAEIEYLAGPHCPRCGQPHSAAPALAEEEACCGACQLRPPAFDPGLSVAAFRGPLRRLVHRLKFSGCAWLAEPLAARAHAFLRACPGRLPPVDGLLPVPLPLPRRLRRGYNQSALLAAALGRRMGLPVLPRALGRRGLGPPQSGLPAARRTENVRRAFRVLRPGAVAGGCWMLVDDVWTTGATMEACATALRRAGCRRVVAFSLARAVERF